MIKKINLFFIPFALFLNCSKKEIIYDCNIQWAKEFEIFANIDFYNYETENQINLSTLNLISIFDFDNQKFIALRDARKNLIWYYNLNTQKIDYEFTLPISSSAYSPFVVDVYGLDSIIYFQYRNKVSDSDSQFIVLASRNKILKNHLLDYPKTIDRHLITEESGSRFSYIKEYFVFSTSSQYGLPGHNSDSLMDTRELVYLAKISKDTLEYQKVPVYGRNYRNRTDGMRNFEQGVNWFFNPKLDRISIYYSNMDTLYHYDFKSGQIAEQVVNNYCIESIPMLVRNKKGVESEIMLNYPYYLSRKYFYCAATNRYIRVLKQFIFDKDLQKSEGGQNVYRIEFLDSNFNFLKCMKMQPNQLPIINRSGLFIREINYEKGLLTIYKYHP